MPGLLSVASPKIIGRLPDGRPVVLNEDGSISTHLMATGNIDGGAINFPTMYGGQKYSPQEAMRIIQGNNLVDPDTGQRLRVYQNEEEALADYMLRGHPQIDREASYIREQYMQEKPKKGLRVKRK